jgi:nucleoside-diphosphate-sugar epimerase
MIKQKVLIAGAGGYIGSKMVETFLGYDCQIVALDRFFFGNTLQDLEVNPKLHIVKDDIRFFDKKILEGVEVVIDLASISNDPSSELLPAVTESINYEGAVRLAKLAKECGVKRYIFSSSCSVYGAGDEILNEESAVRPISTYAKSKIAAEKDLLDLADDQFCVTLLRNGTVYGLSKRRMRFDLIVNIMTLHAWKNGQIFIMGGGKQWRPLVHIDDVISAFYAVMNESDQSKINHQVFNVGSNEQNYQVFQVASRFRSYFPNILIEDTPDDPDPRNYHVNFDKINRILNFSPTKTIDDGIREIKEALDLRVVTDDIKTKTVEFYKYLISADKFLLDIKIENRLF